MYQIGLEACNFYHVLSGNEEKLGIQFNHQLPVESVMLRGKKASRLVDTWTGWQGGTPTGGRRHGSSVPPPFLPYASLSLGSSHVVSFITNW